MGLKQSLNAVLFVTAGVVTVMGMRKWAEREPVVSAQVAPVAHGAQVADKAMSTQAVRAPVGVAPDVSNRELVDAAELALDQVQEKLDRLRVTAKVIDVHMDRALEDLAEARAMPNGTVEEQALRRKAIEAARVSVRRLVEVAQGQL